MKDNELFTLSKQVYEATKWQPERIDAFKDSDGVHKPFYRYTSDYLLEKLPPTIYYKRTPYDLQLHKYALNEYYADYWSYDLNLDLDLEPVSSSVKALLKLTLCLAEEGLL